MRDYMEYLLALLRAADTALSLGLAFRPPNTPFVLVRPMALMPDNRKLTPMVEVFYVHKPASAASRWDYADWGGLTDATERLVNYMWPPDTQGRRGFLRGVTMEVNRAPIGGSNRGADQEYLFATLTFEDSQRVP